MEEEAIGGGLKGGGLRNFPRKDRLFKLLKDVAFVFVCLNFT